MRDDLTADILSTYDNGMCELLVAKVHQLNTVVAVVYRPPDTRMSEFSEMLVKLESCLSSLPNPTPPITVLGDFNFQRNAIVWSRLGENNDGISGDILPIVAGHSDVETLWGKQDGLQAAKLCDLSTKHSMLLLQQVDQPTHGIEVLDLIFTNNSDLFISVAAEWRHGQPSLTTNLLQRTPPSCRALSQKRKRCAFWGVDKG